ncbi:MAG: pyruvate/2-oxoglutarate dehydrogenase complex dihydrolipoamide dehydrogenase (E3) component [Kiritimatiellia bacterium]|jgi:pyruvate/2-oxoglutarate dehydrogenase complex dihydrolipoamide dehydrogenase (E3) component
MSVIISPRDEHNNLLIENTHPENRVNPEPQNPYNLVVIGAGTAGLVTAAGAAGLGAKVALIERHFMGGDCLNYGCVPSKALIRCATAVHDVKSAGAYSVHVPGEPEADFAQVMERMRKLRSQISENDSVQRFTDLGVDVFLGEGKFVSSDTVEVDGKLLRFRKAVIATGARAASPPIPGLDQIDYLNNENLFNLTERPARMLVVGGGPIGCEMAQTFQRLGTEVTLIDRAPHVLSKEDADAAAVVQNAMIADGVNLQLAAKDLRFEARGEQKAAFWVDREGVSQETVADAVLIAVGRAPNVSNMGLETVGVEFDLRKGVTVTDRLQTTNPKIFAAGDVCSRYQFTHAADFLARIVIANSLFGGRQKASDLIIPWATYTDPQIAHVGITEHQAKEDGIAIDTYIQPLEDVDRAILDGDNEGFVKIHTKKDGAEILGATIVARHGGDMIGELVMAMKYKVGLGKVSSVIHPYPTQAEAIRKLGDQYNRTRLTPFVLGLMQKWLRWKRGA